MSGGAVRLATASLWLVALAPGGPLAAQATGSRFAVLPFENTGSYGQDKEVFEGLELALPALIASALDRHPAADAVPRAGLAQALRKYELGPTRRFDAGTAAQVGTGTGAQFAVTGSFSDFYGKLRVSARLVNARTGEIAKVVSNDDAKLRDRAQLGAIVHAIAGRLASAAGLEPLPADASGPPVPTDAISAFGRGLLYESRNDPATAARFYREALTAFPDFPEASAALERVRGG